MQKWHIHSALGRGRPASYTSRSTIQYSRHYNHTTAPHALQSSQHNTVQGPKESPPNRAERLQKATPSPEDLNHRPATHGNTRNPTVLDARHFGVPLNKDIIDRDRLAEPSAGAMSTAGRRAKPVVDPRSLGASPTGPQGAFTIRKIFRHFKDPPIDEQKPSKNLDARPTGAQQPSLIRRVFRDNVIAESQDRAESLIAKPRNSQDGNRVQSHPLIDMDTFQNPRFMSNNGPQQRPHQEDSASYTGNSRARKASQADQTRFPRDRPSFQARSTGDQGRSTRGEGRPAQLVRSRAGRPQASRDSDNPIPRRRKRGIEQSFDNNNRQGPKSEEWTTEERQYLEEKKERESQFKGQHYEPVGFGKKTVTGSAPATASDDLGMSEMLGERILLARKYLDHEFIQWDSKEQKADVMAVVEKLKAVRGGNPNEKAETASPTSSNGGQQAQALMQKLIAGEYAKFKKIGQNDVLGHVERHVHRNDSFYPDDERSLLEKVTSIMPAGQARRARNEVRA